MYRRAVKTIFGEAMLRFAIRRPYDIAWDLILTKPELIQTKRLKALFPLNEDAFQGQQLSILHRAILEIDSSNLSDLLCSGPIDVNLNDSRGRSALWLAVLKNDDRAVIQLLKAKADPNICDYEGNTPLFVAAGSRNGSCVNLVLVAQANVSLANQRTSTASDHMADYQGTAGEIVNHLVNAGANPNARNAYGCTPLTLAAIANNYSIALSLLNVGADIEALDKKGESPLQGTLRFNANDTLQILLCRGADYHRPNRDGQFILHLAAAYGGLQTINILIDSLIKDLDPDIPNRKGETALQVAQDRKEKPDGFVKRFEELLIDIRIRNTVCESKGREDSAGSGDSSPELSESTTSTPTLASYITVGTPSFDPSYLDLRLRGLSKIECSKGEVNIGKTSPNLDHPIKRRSSFYEDSVATDLYSSSATRQEPKMTMNDSDDFDDEKDYSHDLTGDFSCFDTEPMQSRQESSVLKGLHPVSAPATGLIACDNPDNNIDSI